MAGAIGAHELEKRHEKHREKKRYEDEGYSYGGGGEIKGERRRRRSSGGLINEIKDKVGTFLDPDAGKDKEREKRRSRSHGGGRGSRYDDYDGYEDDRYIRRSGRDDRYESRRRDEYY